MTLNRIWLGVLLGILFLLMGGSLVLTTLENQQLKKTVAETQDMTSEEVTEDIIHPVGDEETTQTDANGKAQFVAGVFHLFLPYNENTYLSRFDEVEGKVTDEVLAALKGMMATVDPAITVQNTLDDLDVYTNGTTSNQFLVVATVSLQVGEGVDSVYTQVYQVFLAEDDSYTITYIESLGSIAPFDME